MSTGVSVHAVDISNHQPVLHPRTLDVLYEAGVRRVIVGCQYPSSPWPPGNADSNFAALKTDERFMVAAYFESQEPRIAWPRISSYASVIDWYAVAFEEGGGCETEAALDKWLAQADKLTGKLTRIYTSKYMWDRLGMTTTKYAAQGRLLWNAHYDGKADGFEIPYPFGGWTTCIVDQYSGHGFIPALGFEIDLNEELLVAPSTEEPMKLLALSDVEKARLGAALPGIFSKHFSDLVNLDAKDGYSIGLVDDPNNDVVILTLPKGTVRK